MVDKDVLALLRQNEASQAYQRIIQELGPGLRGYLRAAARSDLHGDELYEELCVTLWEQLPGFARWLDSKEALPEGASSIRAWLYRSARNRAIDWLRRRSRANAPLPSGADFAAADPSASQVLSHKQQQQQVLLALAELTDAERDALILRAERDLSFKEVGEVLGISAAAAKERYHRAKERLRKLLGGGEEPKP